MLITYSLLPGHSRVIRLRKAVTARGLLDVLGLSCDYDLYLTRKETNKKVKTTRLRSGDHLVLVRRFYGRRLSDPRRRLNRSFDEDRAFCGLGKPASGGSHGNTLSLHL
jgi:hypothetical protein